jgi:hypothetical protein
VPISNRSLRHNSYDRFREEYDNASGSKYACDCGQEYMNEEALKRHQVSSYDQQIYIIFIFSLAIFCSKVIAKIDQFHVHFVKKHFHHRLHYVIIYFYVEIKQINVQIVVNLYDVLILLITMKIIVHQLMK